mmetsp:Transcript_11905/g.30093  ORF Transcript_11905/g.30093 Transcript_11905/m.30093 type:complete len:260 (-) Transcript_11905:1102-1881(-)
MTSAQPARRSCWPPRRRRPTPTTPTSVPPWMLPTSGSTTSSRCSPPSPTPTRPSSASSTQPTIWIPKRRRSRRLPPPGQRTNCAPTHATSAIWPTPSPPTHPCLRPRRSTPPRPRGSWTPAWTRRRRGWPWHALPTAWQTSRVTPHASRMSGTGRASWRASWTACASPRASLTTRRWRWRGWRSSWSSWQTALRATHPTSQGSKSRITSTASGRLASRSQSRRAAWPRASATQTKRNASWTPSRPWKMLATRPSMLQRS